MRIRALVSGLLCLSGVTLAAATFAVKDERPPEFLRDVAPILDRGGCSVAACHGKFGGRGGFQLSLLTLSPEDDYAPIVDGGRGRRVNFAHPERSLILLKATGSISHFGGTRFAVGSPQYDTLLRWIRAGAPFSDKDPRVVSVVLKPNKLTLPKVGLKQPIRAIATYTDGSTRDVTAQTVFDTTNPAVFQISTDGVVVGQRWGGGAILGRYLGNIAACFATLPQERKGPYPVIAANNVVDRLVLENLKRLNVVPSGLCTDDEFLRRATIDVAGRLPTPDEVDAFAADKSIQKRAAVIDRLLASPEFVDLRTLQLCDLLRVNPRKLGYTALADRSATLFYDWIRRGVAANKPWDKFVREILMARGSTYFTGPAGFYRIEREPNDRMETLGQAFLGVRMACARCHKHAFDRWTTDDYWNFAAFMDKVAIRGGKLVDENIVYDNPGAKLVNQSVVGHNRGKIAPPTFLGEKAPAPEKPDMVAELADWIVNPKNPFFARATVNRLWSYYFGRGLVHPVDDMRLTTPESVPGLLDSLAKDLVSSGYDTRHVIRTILTSRTYQLSAIPNASNKLDDRFCSHARPRPVTAAVLLDMVNQATGAAEQYSTFQDRAKAVQTAIPPQNLFLTAFGQSHREFLADLNPKLEPNLVQTLLMINSPYIEGKIAQGRTVDEAIKATKTEDELVRWLFLRTFCRPPSAAEVVKATAILAKAPNRKTGAQDLLWALLSSREFYFNH